MGTVKTAADAFKKSVAFSTNQKDRDKSLVNYGRLLSKLGYHSKAVDVFKIVKEATFNSGSGLALSLYNSKACYLKVIFK